MSRKIFLPRPEQENISLASSPPHHRRRRSGVVPLGLGCFCCSISADASSSVATTPIGFGNWQALRLYGVSTMVLSEARGLLLFRVVREGIGLTQRLSATGTCAPTGHRDAHPRTRTSQEPTSHHRQRSPEMERALHPRRSSGLRFQFLSVEVFPFLP